MLDKLGYLAAGLGFTSIAASIAAWYTEKGDDADENAHAERTGIFIGLWPQTFFALAMILFKLKEMGHDKDVQRLLGKLEKKVEEAKK
ncbi:MAG: hypothetical protein JJU46_08120 [Balneolaceae bacterium]|nr:hypothetical protein [Balneolaceae bacterium]MCH8547918.1 hypothetical protein [Balneolaceae bacterium]